MSQAAIQQFFSVITENSSISAFQLMKKLFHQLCFSLSGQLNEHAATLLQKMLVANQARVISLGLQEKKYRVND